MQNKGRFCRIRISDDGERTLQNNLSTLGHCQIKVEVTFSPWKDKTSKNLANKTCQNMANMMCHHKMVVPAGTAITHLETNYVFKCFCFLGIVKIFLLNGMNFWKRKILTHSAMSHSNITGRKKMLKLLCDCS